MQVSFELDVLGYLLMFSDMLYCKQSMNASLWRTWIGTCCLTVIHWHKWLFSVQSTLKSWFGAFVKSFCENDQKMKQHLFKEMEATRAKVTTELCAHTHTHRLTQAQKQILTNVSRSHPSSSILPQGTTSLIWGNRWAEPSTVFFCCCFFPLVKVRKTCNSGSVAKCQTTWKIIKTDHLKTPTRPDGPMSL